MSDTNKVQRGRTLTRSQALQLLFQAETRELTVEQLLLGDYLVSKGPLDQYAVRLALGCDAKKRSIDEVLRQVSENWSLERMSCVDRNLLRLAVYELRFLEDDQLDDAVVIDEAVTLAKAYGTDDSSRFVNGVLGRIARLEVLPSVYEAPTFDSDEEAAGVFRGAALQDGEE